MVCLCLAGGRLSISDKSIIDARLNEAAHLYARGNLSSAAKFYQDILSDFPQNPDALLMLGNIAQQAQNSPLALGLFEQALAARPDFPLARYNRGVLLRVMGKTDEALMSVQMAVDSNPALAAAWDLMGQLYKDKGDQEQAILCHERALTLQPNNAYFYGNYGLVLLAMGDKAGAFRAAQKAESLDSDFPPVLMGNLLLSYGYPEKAAEKFARARVLRQGFTDGSANEAMALLQIGETEKGWALWETRADLVPDNQPDLKNIPLWQGQNIDHLLLYEDQGLGDALQFLRYVPMISSRATQVTLRLREPLRRLAADNFSSVNVNSDNDPLPQASARCRLSSLPFFCGAQLDTLPPAPYLRASDDCRALWREKLRTLPHPRIGLVWAGNIHFRNDAARSLNPEILEPLIQKFGKYFISLQKDKRDEVPALFDPTGEINDFADTAALIAELDLVISVDTATAHLAGAMGKPVWILLPFISDWRWMLGRLDSPWYKSARLFRQHKPGDWQTVIQDIIAETEKFIAGDKTTLEPEAWTGENLRQHPQALPLPS